MLPLVQRSGLEVLGGAVLAFTISRVGTSDLNAFEQSMAILGQLVAVRILLLITGNQSTAID